MSFLCTNQDRAPLAINPTFPNTQVHIFMQISVRGQAVTLLYILTLDHYISCIHAKGQTTFSGLIWRIAFIHDFYIYDMKTASSLDFSEGSGKYNADYYRSKIFFPHVKTE